MVNKTLTLASVVMLALQLTGVIAVPWLIVAAPLLTLAVCTLIAAATQVYLMRRAEKALQEQLGSLVGMVAPPTDGMEGGYL